MEGEKKNWLVSLRSFLWTASSHLKELLLVCTLGLHVTSAFLFKLKVPAFCSITNATTTNK